MSRIRWHNRLAAWLYGLIGTRLTELAAPVWDEEFRRERGGGEDEGDWIDGASFDNAMREAYDEGFRDAEREFRETWP